jgi:ABC-type glutathione transport system ATPase component
LDQTPHGDSAQTLAIMISRAHRKLVPSAKLLYTRGMDEFINELKTVPKGLAGLWALRAIDLRVGRGELLMLLGPSGSGKTALLRLLPGSRSLHCAPGGRKTGEHGHRLGHTQLGSPATPAQGIPRQSCGLSDA